MMILIMAEEKFAFCKIWYLSVKIFLFWITPLKTKLLYIEIEIESWNKDSKTDYRRYLFVGQKCLNIGDFLGLRITAQSTSLHISMHCSRNFIKKAYTHIYTLIYVYTHTYMFLYVFSYLKVFPFLKIELCDLKGRITGKEGGWNWGGRLKLI